MRDTVEWSPQRLHGVQLEEKRAALDLQLSAGEHPHQENHSLQVQQALDGEEGGAGELGEWPQTDQFALFPVPGELLVLVTVDTERKREADHVQGAAVQANKGLRGEEEHQESHCAR